MSTFLVATGGIRLSSIVWRFIMQLFTSAVFLERLNTCVGHQIDESQRCGARWTKPVDFVLVGLCSGHQYGDPLHSATGLKKHFDAHPGSGPQAGQKAIIMSSCCGQYSAADRERFGAAFPDVELHFPEHGDYCDNFGIWPTEQSSYCGRQVADDLIAADYMEAAS